MTGKIIPIVGGNSEGWEKYAKELLDGTSAPEPTAITPATNIDCPDNYIILPAKKHRDYEYPDMLVNMGKTHFGKDASDTRTLVYGSGYVELTIRQFVDFLNLLRSGQAFDGTGGRIQPSKLLEIFNDITEVKNPWRAEHLDARFSKSGEQMNMLYHVIENGQAKEVMQPIDGYLTSNKNPGISLDDWLATATEHGLPRKQTSNGNLWYWAPTDGTVARFDANSGRAFLDCVRYPADSNPRLGVRLARAKILSYDDRR